MAALWFILFLGAAAFVGLVPLYWAVTTYLGVRRQTGRRLRKALLLGAIVVWTVGIGFIAGGFAIAVAFGR